MVHLVMFLHSAISAGTYLAAKRALGELSPFEVALVRFALSSLAFGLLLWRRPVRVARRDLLALAGLGIIAIPVNQGLFLAGMAWTTPGHAALLYALTPVFVFLIARVRLGERAGPAKLAGIALAFAGVVVVLLGRGAVGLHGSSRQLAGDLLILLAVVAWSVFAVAGKPYAQRYGAVGSTGVALVLGTLAYLPFGLVATDWSLLGALSATGWASLGYLVLLTSVVAYILYYWALSRTEASRVAIWSNLQPVLTALLAWAIAGERLTAPFVAGGAMVIAGVILTERG
ncbi:DMT family transporter [Anaeromyxobacter sp. PSR-1]|uniref:DMT family transporter n=1 Tax=Anaeromyxobacter sp. PSR-1 TaxID=1300915 RepID=UPI0005DEF861|nr:DMT family transporter [Anaeromyxobacter sp. PSR-1]GAO02242.1 putative transporter [Anaeromyxobacter sp. PSR-1]